MAILHPTHLKVTVFRDLEMPGMPQIPVTVEGGATDVVGDEGLEAFSDPHGKCCPIEEVSDSKANPFSSTGGLLLVPWG